MTTKSTSSIFSLTFETMRVGLCVIYHVATSQPTANEVIKNEQP